MNDYTPTTEEVRKIYWWRKLTDRYGVNAVYRSHASEEAEFDRWLESILQKAQIAERERIIDNIYDRVSDLRSCTKQDNCVELGELIEEYIPEWTETK